MTPYYNEILFCTWLCPQQFGLIQNNVDRSKRIWTGPKSFWTNKRTRYTSTTTWIDTQNDFCNFHTTINYILLFWCWHFKNKKKLKDWMKNWKKKKERKADFLSKLWKMKKILPTPHPSLKTPYPPTTPLLNEFKVSLLFRYFLTNCLFYLDKKKVARWFLLKV